MSTKINTGMRQLYKTIHLFKHEVCYLGVSMKLNTFNTHLLGISSSRLVFGVQSNSPVLQEGLAQCSPFKGQPIHPPHQQVEMTISDKHNHSVSLLDQSSSFCQSSCTGSS